MSRIGLAPVIIPAGVTLVAPSEREVVVKGTKGTISVRVPEGLQLSIASGVATLVATREDKLTKGLHGLTRTLINNAIIGTTQGWDKTVELVGVGFRVQGGGEEITLSVGFSHPVNFKAATGITLTVKDNNKITVIGASKELVGETAARLRAIRPPEPYKGKGIRYLGEVVRKKAGKAVKAAGGTAA